VGVKLTQKGVLQQNLVYRVDLGSEIAVHQVVLIQHVAVLVDLGHRLVQVVIVADIVAGIATRIATDQIAVFHRGQSICSRRILPAF